MTRLIQASEMFRNRKTSQKPDEDLICKFRQAFPDVVSNPALGASTHGSVSVHQQIGMDPANATRPAMDHEDMKINDPTPRALQDFRFTPSFMDPNSYAFMSLANQPPGYYTPTSGGIGPIYHNQAGDLHTPTMGINMITPMSLSHHVTTASPNDPLPASMGMEHFTPEYMQQPFHTINPFTQQPSYAPSQFLHRDTGYDPMDRSGEDSSVNDVDMQMTAAAHFAPSIGDFPDHMEIQGSEGEKFRYNTTLRAPTAMVKHTKEIPVTYLNKGQAYSLSVIDANPPAPGTQPIKYRTFVRVSFEEEEQRSKPAACWQLWKEGRGSSEAHQRGGKLLAVEFVEPSQGPDDERNRQIQLEKASFDGFAVTWTAHPATGASTCAISVRFNFLSTDFSHSKGVKGIPVRLCAKTEVVTPEYADNGTAPNMEVSYCRVKLFRDHGAERKLSNDVAHVKKAIEKLKQQIAQAEMGGNFGKRKRSNAPVTMKGSDTRPVKMQKHKRTWSMSSQEGGEKLSMEDDLHAKLAAMQDMFSSTRPISILGLRGEERDDPDLFPVHLPGDMNDFVKFEPLSRTSTYDSRQSIGGTSAASILSPTSSSISMSSPRAPHRQLSAVQCDSGYSASQDNSPQQSCLSRNNSELSADRLLLSHPIKIQKPDGTSSQLSTGYIEAVDIDPTYRPPADRLPKPIACFYIRFPARSSEEEDYYRAIYLTERTVRDLMHKISEKQKIDPERIIRVLHVNQKGLKVMVDDDVVQALPEGQDMIAEISEASKADVAADSPEAASPSPAIEVQLTF